MRYLLCPEYVESTLADVKLEIENQLRRETARNENLKQSLDVVGMTVREREREGGGWRERERGREREGEGEL